MSKIIFILGLLCVVLIITAIVLIGKIHVSKKKERQIKENADLILKKERENEKRKEKLDTGNGVTDFNNSIELLQDIADRR